MSINTREGFKTTLPYAHLKLGYSIPQLRGAYKRLAALGLLTYTEDRLKDNPCYLVKLTMERIVEITFFGSADDDDDESLADELVETEEGQGIEKRDQEPKATPDHPAAWRRAPPQGNDNRKDTNMPAHSSASLSESAGSKNKSAGSNSASLEKVQPGKSASPKPGLSLVAKLGPKIPAPKKHAKQSEKPEFSTAFETKESAGSNSEEKDDDYIPLHSIAEPTGEPSKGTPVIRPKPPKQAATVTGNAEKLVREEINPTPLANRPPVTPPANPVNGTQPMTPQQRCDLFVRLWIEIIQRGRFEGPRPPGTSDRQAALGFFTAHPTFTSSRLAATAIQAWQAPMEQSDCFEACRRSLTVEGFLKSLTGVQAELTAAKIPVSVYCCLRWFFLDTELAGLGLKKLVEENLNKSYRKEDFWENHDKDAFMDYYISLNLPVPGA